jgi:hypothetical protein
MKALKLSLLALVFQIGLCTHSSQHGNELNCCSLIASGGFDHDDSRPRGPAVGTSPANLDGFRPGDGLRGSVKEIEQKNRPAMRRMAPTLKVSFSGQTTSDAAKFGFVPDSFTKARAGGAQGIPALNPLLKQASTASVGILFAGLIWRTLAVYEAVSQVSNPWVKVVATLPILIILFGNLLGFVANVMKPNNFKNWLKAILAMNIVREWAELAFNVFFIVFASAFSLSHQSSRQPREVYFGRFVINVWWIALCFGFSRSRWVLSIQPGAAEKQRQQQEQQQYQPRFQR